MEHGASVHERRAGERRAPVVECGRGAFAHDGVDFARQVHVERLDKGVGSIVGQFRAREKRFVERVDLRNARSHRLLRRAPQHDLLHQLFEFRHETRECHAAREAEEFDLVVAVQLRLAEEGGGVSLKHARQLAKLVAEARKVGARKLREGVKVGVGEEVHAARAVVIGQVGGDALAARAEGHGHLPLRPRKRLDAPLLSPPAVVLERLARALEHHHVAERELERTREPAVQLHKKATRHVALRKLKFTVHHVAAEDRTHHHVATLRDRDAGKVPELSLEERQRGDGVVARRDRHHVAARTMPQVALAREQHGGVRVEIRPHALLEDERVVSEVVGMEDAPTPHRARRHEFRTAHALAAEPCEELLDGRPHSSSPSSP